MKPWGNTPKKQICKRGHDLSITRSIDTNGKNHGCYECLKTTSRAQYAKDTPSRRASRLRWKENNPEAHKLSKWKSYLKTHYRLSLDDYNRMLTAQKGKCFICGDPPSKSHKKLHVDHDHFTGENRSLLCNACNAAVGQLRESPKRAYLVAKYLERYQQLRIVV